MTDVGDEKTPAAGTRRGLDQFDELFLERPAATPEEPPASFRDRAIGDVGNPLEKIDSVFRLTATRLWLGVAGLAALVGALVVWGFVAERVVTTQAYVVVLPPSGLTAVGQPALGVVGSITAQEGDEVERGRQLAVLVLADGGTVPILAPISGRVVAVDAAEGQISAAGTSLFLLAPLEEPMALGLLGPAELAELEVGQPATVAIPSLNPQRYGRVTATVQSIGAVPATRGRIVALLGSDAQAAGVLQSGPTYEVQLKLTPADTPSGVDWTVGDGPDTPLPVGTTGMALIETDRRSLASRAFGR